MRFYVSKYIGHGVRVGVPVNLGTTRRPGAPTPMYGARPAVGSAIPWCTPSKYWTFGAVLTAVWAIWAGWPALIATGLFLVVAAAMQGNFITQCERLAKQEAAAQRKRAR